MKEKENKTDLGFTKYQKKDLLWDIAVYFKL